MPKGVYARKKTKRSIRRSKRTVGQKLLRLAKKQESLNKQSRQIADEIRKLFNIGFGYGKTQRL